MASELQALINKQILAVAALQKRLAGVDAMLNIGQQERNNLVVDILTAEGKLAGLKEALATITILGTIPGATERQGD